VICAYGHSFTDGVGIRYSVSYDEGDSWRWGAWEPDPGRYFVNPDVTCRGGQGSAIVYDVETDEFDPVWFRHRDHFSPGDWDAAVGQVNSIDTGTALPSRIEWLPPRAGETSNYGVIYISGDGVPYFVRMTGGIFVDGFESGDTSAWSAAVP
jgi:hypothetical protein